MISEDFPPNVVGGVGSHSYDLASGLVQHGWAVGVLAGGSRDLPQPRFEGGMHVCRMQLFDDNGRRRLRTSAVVAQCRRLAHLVRPCLLHLHDPLYLPAALCLSKELGLPMVFTQHNAFRHLLEQRRTHDPHSAEFLPHLSQEAQAEGLVLQRADAVICVSETVKRQMHAGYRSGCPLWVVPNGVDIASFRNVDRERSRRLRACLADPSERIALFVGRACQDKGLPELITAVALLPTRNCRIRFVFIFSQLEPWQLEALRGMAPLKGRAVFLNDISRAEIPLYYSAAHLVVMPSRTEAFGLVAIEAMAAARPLIVSDIEPLNQFVQDGVSGRIVPLAAGSKPLVDVRCLAAAIQEVAGLPEKRLKKMGKFGLRAACNAYSKNRMVERTIKVYRRLTVRQRLRTGEVLGGLQSAH